MPAFGERVRVAARHPATKSADKRWNWVRRGAPIIVEIGPRDAAGGQVTFMRRDELRDGDKIESHALPRDEFVAEVPALLDEIQARLFAEAKARLDANIDPHEDVRGASRSISVRPQTTTRAASSRAGCTSPGRSPKGPSWRRSRKG